LQGGVGLGAPGKATVLVLETFEDFVLILLFHALPVRRALLVSLALGREGLGTQVPGLSTEPRHADRSGTGEFGAPPREGAGEVAELPESDE